MAYNAAYRLSSGEVVPLVAGAVEICDDAIRTANGDVYGVLQTVDTTGGIYRVMSVATQLLTSGALRIWTIFPSLNSSTNSNALSALLLVKKPGGIVEMWRMAWHFEGAILHQDGFVLNGIATGLPAEVMHAERGYWAWYNQCYLSYYNHVRLANGQVYHNLPFTLNWTRSGTVGDCTAMAAGLAAFTGSGSIVACNAQVFSPIATQPYDEGKTYTQHPDGRVVGIVNGGSVYEFLPAGTDVERVFPTHPVGMLTDVCFGVVGGDLYMLGVIGDGIKPIHERQRTLLTPGFSPYQSRMQNNGYGSPNVFGIAMVSDNAPWWQDKVGVVEV